eukprot:363186-Chlamydomonas_euryale.AAC.2
MHHNHTVDLGLTADGTAMRLMYNLLAAVAPGCGGKGLGSEACCRRCSAEGCMHIRAMLYSMPFRPFRLSPPTFLHLAVELSG